MDEITGSINYVQKILSRAQGVTQQPDLIPTGWSQARAREAQSDPFENVAAEESAWPISMPSAATPRRLDSGFQAEPLTAKSPPSQSAQIKPAFEKHAHLQVPAATTQETIPRMEKLSAETVTLKASAEIQPRTPSLAQPEKREEGLRGFLKNQEPIQSVLPRDQETLREKRAATEDKLRAAQAVKSEPVPPTNARTELKPARNEAAQPETGSRVPRPEISRPRVSDIKPRASEPTVLSQPLAAKTQTPNLNPPLPRRESPKKQPKPESQPRLVIDRLRVEVIPTALPAQPARTVVLRRVSTQDSGNARQPVSQLRFGLGQL
jgi:hypothetical protein